MISLNPKLLLTDVFSDKLASASIANRPRGTYNPMQFALRLRKDIQQELEGLEAGVHLSKSLTNSQTQAFSTYMHETIHWWQHVGSNFGFISSLKFPAQAHVNHSLLKSVLARHGAFKSIRKYDILNPSSDTDINRVLNYWHDIEFAGNIALNPLGINKLTANPYFDSWGHSYNMMWGSSLWLLGSTFDPEFSFLPNIKKWEEGFKVLRENKAQGYYYGSDNKVCPIGTKAIFEGQARFSQMQYLYRAHGKQHDMNEFAKIGMLNGIYIEAFRLFLDTLNEPVPMQMDDPLVGLFLLICDIAINPTDGFPFDVVDFESFIISNDPGYRFCILCQIIRDKHTDLKKAIHNYSKDEYIAISERLVRSMGCFSPFESAVYVYDWMQKQDKIKRLMKEHYTYQFGNQNLPVRLFFSKFLRFQEDKFKHPHFFCWPGIHFVEHQGGDFDVLLSLQLFEKHKALFIEDLNGSLLHSANEDVSVLRLDDTLNEFFSWNSVYFMIREWISEPGPFRHNFEWLTSKHSKDQMIQWSCKNFESSFGVDPRTFRIIP